MSDATAPAAPAALAEPRPRRLWWPLVLFMALAVLLGVGLTLKPREVPSPFIGKPAPDFSLPRLDDPARLVTPAELRGQPWLLNVWASWCAPCREEHPLLIAIAREQGVRIVGINYKDDARNAKEWLLRLGDPYLMTVTDRDGRASIDYGVYGVPETFLIDAQGMVRAKHIGPLTLDAWQREMAPTLKRLKAGTAP